MTSPMGAPPEFEAVLESPPSKGCPPPPPPYVAPPLHSPNLPKSSPSGATSSAAASVPAPAVDPVFYQDAWKKPTEQSTTTSSATFGGNGVQQNNTSAAGAFPQPAQTFNPEQMMQYMMMQQQQMQQLMMTMMPTANTGPYAYPVAGSGMGGSWDQEATATTQSSPTALPERAPSAALLQKLVGTTPNTWNWNNWMDKDSGDKEPIPKWDGTRPASKLKPWLKDLRIWRQGTATPVQKHGLKLYKSFDSGSWLKAAAERISEEQLYTPEAWGLILKEILTELKPYLDVETEVLIEELFFVIKKESRELMSSYLTKKINKKREVEAALGKTRQCCANCLKESDVPQKVPDEIWTYILKKGASLTEDQRKQIFQWDSSQLSGPRLQELLLRFDRTDAVIAAGMTAHAPKSYMHEQDGPSSSSYVSNALSDSALPKEMVSFMSADPSQAEEAENDDDDESDDDYDMTHWDDDGQPLVDPEGQSLCPFEPEKTYGEEEALFLCAFAGTYREVRGALQATRIGRDQKIVQKRQAKGKSKGKRKGRDIKPGQASRKPINIKIRTSFKDKVGGSSSRGTATELLKRTKCYKCGKLGHVQRNCKQDAAPGAKSPSAPVKTYFQFVQSPASCLFNSMQFSLASPQISPNVSEVADNLRSDDEKGHISCNFFIGMQSASYPSTWVGLTIAPCHAMVDTGAQDGVVGEYHFQR